MENNITSIDQQRQKQREKVIAKILAACEKLNKLMKQKKEPNSK